MNTIPGDGLTENDRYGDEVLNASWLPDAVLTALTALNMSETFIPPRRQSRQTRCFGSDRDAEDFMQLLYRSQE